MAEEMDPAASARQAEERQRAYRTANRLITSAGLALGFVGVRPNAPEMEALRRALRAVNFAGGIEQPRKEAVRAFPPGGGRFPRSAV
jgi:hypothetical protein